MIIIGAIGLLSATPVAASSSPPPKVPGGFSGMSATQNPNHYIPSQDAAWLAKKKAHLLHPIGLIQPNSCPQIVGSGFAALAVVPAVCTPPRSHLLDTSVVSNTVEPRGDSYQRDANGNSFPDDQDMWRLCASGATTNALAYWGLPVNSYGKHAVTDQYATTTWDDAKNRSYLMYLAWQMQPPGWSPGEMDTTFKPSHGVSIDDVRTALNWEASGHNTSTYANYYYATRKYGTSDATLAQLNSDVTWDIGIDGEAVHVVLDANLMPNWSSYHSSHPTNTVVHSITIIGYNNITSQYTYTDTCGYLDPSIGGCGSNQNGGTNTVSQATLWQAITHVGANSGVGWNF